MAIDLDRLVNVHHDTLKVRSQRMEVISGNLANANTPGYKARDIDFQAAMKTAQSTQSLGQGLKMTGSTGASNLVKTHENHLSGGSQMQSQIDFIIPNQPDTGDGNTVDVQQQRNAFLETAMRYEASLMLLNGKFKGMKKALSSGNQ
jgi:flagellar basal-body rod protein FlgB